MTNEIKIRAANGGYIITEGGYAQRERIFTSIEDLFAYLLLVYEGRSNLSPGQKGTVRVDRGGKEPRR